MKTKNPPNSFPRPVIVETFLMTYTGLSAPKLKEQLNANIHYQIFYGICISSKNPLTNYKIQNHRIERQNAEK